MPKYDPKLLEGALLEIGEKVLGTNLVGETFTVKEFVERLPLFPPRGFVEISLPLSPDKMDQVVLKEALFGYSGLLRNYFLAWFKEVKLKATHAEMKVLLREPKLFTWRSNADFLILTSLLDWNEGEGYYLRYLVSNDTKQNAIPDKLMENIWLVYSLVKQGKLATKYYRRYLKKLKEQENYAEQTTING